MKRLIPLGSLLILLSFWTQPALCDTYVAGQVSGTWTTAGSPYVVLADVEIPAALSLTIQPGVEVKFTGQFKLIAHGPMTAVGTPTDSIRFTHHLPYPNYTWAGLFFENTVGSSELAYCVIEWGYAQGQVGQTSSKGGGVHALSAALSIHNCRFYQNKADTKGGAIFAHNITGAIHDNLITNNTCNGDGGGMFVEYTNNADIHDNVITSNSADNGGGLFLVYTGGVLSDNVINYNSATSSNGGGILLDHSSPLIQNCKINHNTASSSYGAGVYCQHFASPLLMYNEICFNNYTAIYCGDNCSPTIDNNTIHGNGSYAIRTYLSSNPFGRNNIITGNSYAFYVSSGCSIYLTYSNIQVYWSGAGNINVQPFFVNPYGDDFNLMPFSPCIDAGSPQAPLDPDGTIADMGAHYFDQNQPQGTSAITLTPFGSPIVLPPTGGTVWFGLSIMNSPLYFNLFDGWYNLQQPDGQIIPMVLRTNLYLPAGGNLSRTLSLTLSSTTMPGTYTVTAYTGEHPTVIEDFDSFTFEKSATDGLPEGPATVTLSDGEVSETFELPGTALPQATALKGNYPDPFNPTTTIAFDLAQAAPVRLAVYDLQGRQVADLVDGWRAAGSHEVTFDASGLASGLYLYVLQAGEVRSVGKMTLMK